MTRCHVEKRIRTEAGAIDDYTCLFYDLDVAATPERGCELHEGRWFSGPLTFVVWNVDEERFKCRVADERPGSDGIFDYNHDFLVQNALHEGWHLCTSAGAAILER